MTKSIISRSFGRAALATATVMLALGSWLMMTSAPADATSSYTTTSCHCSLGQAHYILSLYVAASGGNYGVYNVQSGGGYDYYMGFEYSGGGWRQTVKYGLYNNNGTNFSGPIFQPPVGGEYLQAGTVYSTDNLNPFFY
jgi:hypothetical protein